MNTTSITWVLLGLILFLGIESANAQLEKPKATPPARSKPPAPKPAGQNMEVKPAKQLPIVSTDGWKPFLFQGKWGYKNSNLDVTVEPTLDYDYCWPYYDGLARVEKNGYYYFIDVNGVKITQTSFDEANDFAEGVAAVKDYKSNKWMFIDKAGNYKFYEQYDRAYSFFDGTAIVMNAEQYFFIDKTGKKTIERGFDRATQFQNGFARVREHGSSSYVFITRSGAKTFSEEFDYVFPYEGGMAFVSDSVRGNFTIDTKGNKIRSFTYELRAKWNFMNYTCKVFVNGLACAYDTVTKNYFYVGTNFEKASENYKYASAFDENGYATVQTFDNKYHYINASFSNVYSKTFIKVYDWSKDRLFVTLQTEDSLWKYMNINGDFVKGVTSKYSFSFACGFAAINASDERWFINYKGEKVYGPYKWTGGFTAPEGLAAVQEKDNTCYFIDRLGGKHGQYNGWTYMSIFSKGYAAVGDGSTSTYFVDATLTRVFNQTFEIASAFNWRGYAKVRNNQLWGLIDTNGKLVIPYKYENENDCPGEPPK